MKKINFYMLTLILGLVFSSTSCGPETTTVPGVRVTGITISPTAAIVIAAGVTTTLEVTVTPSDATNTEVSWSSDAPAIATVTAAGVVKGESEGTANIRATAKDGSGITASKSVTVEGVLINGLVWATRNVAAFRTFAPTPENAGMFYQWNRNTAYPATGTVTWNSVAPSATWNTANDPCPDGWRFPTKADFDKLLATTVKYDWVKVNNVEGGRFTNQSTGKSIFLPAAGRRNYINGVLEGKDEWGAYYGAYWTSTKYEGIDHAHYLYLDNSSQNVDYNDPFLFGHSIRPVKK